MGLIRRIKISKNRLQVKIINLDLRHNILHDSLICLLFFLSKNEFVFCLRNQILAVFLTHLKRPLIQKQLSIINKLFIFFIVLTNLVQLVIIYLKLKRTQNPFKLTNSYLRLIKMIKILKLVPKINPINNEILQKNSVIVTRIKYLLSNVLIYFTCHFKKNLNLNKFWFKNINFRFDPLGLLVS